MVGDLFLRVYVSLLQLVAQPNVFLGQRGDLVVEPSQVIGHQFEETMDLVAIKAAEPDCEVPAADFIRTPGMRQAISAHWIHLSTATWPPMCLPPPLALLAQNRIARAGSRRRAHLRP